jgi:hypothetical protein
MSKPLLPLVVVRADQPWILRTTFSRSAAYRRHRASLERIETYVEMLEYLEQLVVRLRLAATIDRKRAATQEEWLARSEKKMTAFFEQVCVVHDIRRGIGYAARFLNTTTVHASGTSQQQALAKRASRVVGELLFPPRWRPRGPQKYSRAGASVQATRSTFHQTVRQIWKAHDESDRRAELLRHIAGLGWQISLPLTIGRRPPTRVTDLVMSQHTGIGQKRLRRTSGSAIAEFIFR